MRRESLIRITSLVVSVLLLGLVQAAALTQPVQAQFWKEIQNKAKQVVTDEALEQVDNQLGHLISKTVSDGRFMVALSPWSAGDGSGTEDYVTISGTATFAPTRDGFSLMLCEDPGGRGWSTRLTLQGGQGMALVPQDSSSYDLTSTLAALNVTDAHARVAGGATGTITLQTVTENLWTGTARLTIPAAFLSEDGEAEPVQAAATFRARPEAEGGAASSCSDSNTRQAYRE